MCDKKHMDTGLGLGLTPNPALLWVYAKKREGRYE